MINLGNVKCPNCGWVHAGIAEVDAVAAVGEFNQHLATLSPEAQAKFGGEQSLEIYRRCFRCGAPSDTFVPAATGDAPLGWTLQAVIAPSGLRKSE